MNYYAILGISIGADDEAIRRAFRALARRYHPDAGDGSSAEKFRQIFEAYETLRDPIRRATYDASLRPPQQTPRRINIEPLRPTAGPEPLRSPFRAGEFRAYRSFADDRFDSLEEFFDRMSAAFDEILFRDPFGEP
jgi:curved DNA-binding protein CbpA